MDNSFVQQLYPLQDKVLQVIQSIETENILANKLSALTSREEPKDLADIWGLCTKLGLSLDAALSGARSKAAGIFPADLARILISATHADWEVIRWSDAPDPDVYLSDLNQLGEQLVLLR